MIKLIVSGRVGSDAQLKTVGDTMVCSFSIAHTEKTYESVNGEKTIWVSCSIWGERAEKLNPHITKGTYLVVMGSYSVNAYLKDGKASAMINCRVNSLEFGGKPQTEAPITTPPTGKVTFEGVDGDLPF